MQWRSEFLLNTMILNEEMYIMICRPANIQFGLRIIRL